MKSFLKIAIRPLLCGIAVMLFALQPLQADEPVNVSDMKDCREFKADAERLLCYDTVANGRSRILAARRSRQKSRLTR